jgi:hypothetical protein
MQMEDATSAAEGANYAARNRSANALRHPKSKFLMP